MKTFLDYYNVFKNDKSVRFTIYYVVKGKTPKIEESDGCTFTVDKNNGRITIIRPSGIKGAWMRRVMRTNSSSMYFGLFKEENLNVNALKDNWNCDNKKMAYLNKEDAEKELSLKNKTKA